MIEFAWTWAFLALPLPLAVRRWLTPAAPDGGGALRVPELEAFRYGETLGRTRRASSTTRLLISALAWVLLVTATARPQWLGDPIELPMSGRDLMLAVDLSGSMKEEDFELGGRRVDRLTATKYLAGDFIERRVGDRLGLILFGERAYLQTPLTFDRKTVRTLLDESVIGLAGAEATAIGDAIGLAVKRLQQTEGSSRVLVLLTDGVNNAGAVDPLQAAELAAGAGLKIYTIGVGADAMLVRDLFGTRRINPSRDLDEKTLKAIAQKTGGRYFRARDSRELAEIYELLDQLEPSARETATFRPTQPLFPWPLGAAVTIALLMLAQPLLPRSVHAR